jgi:hypothetical protein
MTNDERMQRESSLIATIRTKLPEFAKACADDTELVLLHQDAFAADYQEDELHASRHGESLWSINTSDRKPSILSRKANRDGTVGVCDRAAWFGNAGRALAR